MAARDPSPFQLLLVEDADADRLLLEKAMDRLGDAPELKSVGTGERALAHLVAASIHGGPPMVLLLDLSLPGLSGEDLLVALKKDPKLNRIPVVVWTGAHEPGVRERMLGLGADECLHKPQRLDEFDAVAAQLVQVARRLAHGEPS